MAVTAVLSIHQCAEIASTVAGRGISSPKRVQPCVYTFWETAFIGFPWPKKTTGIVGMLIGPHSYAGRKNDNLFAVRQALQNGRGGNCCRERHQDHHRKKSL